jgi:hypothetical protein
MAPPAILAIGAGAIIGALGRMKAANANANATLREAQYVREDAQNVAESALPLYAEADASDYNAALADTNAAQSIEAAAETERRQRVTAAKQLGEIRARYGASGAGINYDVLEESVATAELDALTIRHEGALKARAYQQEAAQLRYRAANARQQAGLVERRAGVVYGRAGGIESKASDIRSLGKYEAASSLLTSLGSSGILKRTG